MNEKKGPWLISTGRFYTLLLIVGLGLAVHRAVPDNGWSSILVRFVVGFLISAVMDKRWTKEKTS